MLRPVARGLDSCLETLQAVMAELERRQVLFDAARGENIQRWNQAVAAERLLYVLVVVDDSAELAAVETADRAAQARQQEALSALASLPRLGRATGFHVIVTTQRPEAKVVAGQIKANMPATVAFRVRANVNSKILLGESNYAAAALPPDIRGRAIWQWERETEFQAVCLEKQEAEALERAYPRLPVPAGAGSESVTPCPTCPGSNVVELPHPWLSEIRAGSGHGISASVDRAALGVLSMMRDGLGGAVIVTAGATSRSRPTSSTSGPSTSMVAADGAGPGIGRGQRVRNSAPALSVLPFWRRWKLPESGLRPRKKRCSSSSRPAAGCPYCVSTASGSGRIGEAGAPRVTQYEPRRHPPGRADRSDGAEVPYG